MQTQSVFTPSGSSNENELSIATLSEIPLIDSPINPDWIISGTPRARSAMHSAGGDAISSTHVWDCTAGSFNWHFTVDETVYIVEGSVRITRANGKVESLSPGQMAHFSAGTTKRWDIDHYVKKIAFCRRVMPIHVLALFHMRNKMREVWNRWV